MNRRGFLKMLGAVPLVGALVASLPRATEPLPAVEPVVPGLTGVNFREPTMIAPRWFTRTMITDVTPVGFTVHFDVPAPPGGSLDWTMFNSRRFGTEPVAMGALSHRVEL